MYGDNNISFIYNDVYFILFDDVIWENDNKAPDFVWLEKEAEKALKYKQKIILTHIPPFSDQFTKEYQNTFNRITKKYKISMSLHGHHHIPEEGKLADNGIEYRVIGSSMKNSYGILKFGNGDKLTYEHGNITKMDFL